MISLPAPKDHEPIRGTRYSEEYGTELCPNVPVAVNATNVPLARKNVLPDGQK